MSKTKAASSVSKPAVQEHTVASLPETSLPEQGFKTHWQGGNPFDRMEGLPKAEKVGRR